MCGIIGEIGNEPVANRLVDGLHYLEYRGYDSAGIATLETGTETVELIRVRAEGKLRNLETKLLQSNLHGTIGIGHTRWATHGSPTEQNAHPHTDQKDEFCIVHNGIIENFALLKNQLLEDNVVFESETDTEVIVQLIAKLFNGDLAEAVRLAMLKIEGTYALACISVKQPDQIIVARNQLPLIIGHGDSSNFVSSDVTGFLAQTNRVTYLDDGEMAVLTATDVKLFKIKDGSSIKRKQEVILWNINQAQKAGYDHFMLKEINEQPEVLQDTLRGRISELPKKEHSINLGLEKLFSEKIDQIQIIACGTSLHAGLVGKFLFEQIAGIFTSYDYASEFRYRHPIVSPHSLAIAISQSGETADTLAAVEEAKKLGSRTLCIANVVGSSLTRKSDETIYTYAGPEISVASTKAFTTQLACLYLLAFYLGQNTGKLVNSKMKEHLKHLRMLPRLVNEIVSHSDVLKTWAKRFHHYKNFLYLGRGVNYPVALEGALKLKEISYIHAEGYPAGEMKHGPIALINEHLPTMFVAVDGPNFEKVINNIEQVKARSGEVLVITNRAEDLRKYSEYIFEIPKIPELFTPILTVIPLQLFAYYVARELGCDVDQPRNLAKAVVVE